MFHTSLTTSWHVRSSMSGAPMAGIESGRLARAERLLRGCFSHLLAEPAQEAQ